MATDSIDSGEPIVDLPPLIEPEFEPQVELPSAPARGHRPPRRRFLAPVETPAAAPPRAPSSTFDIPELIEPVAVSVAPTQVSAEPAKAPAAPVAPAEPPEALAELAPAAAEAVPSSTAPAPVSVQAAAPYVKPAPVPPPATTRVKAVPQRKALSAVWARWQARARTRARLPITRRARLIAGAVIIGVICLVVAIAYIAKFHPFSHVEHYAAAMAPSDPAARLAYFQRGAQAGDAAAQLQLAILYAKGEGVAQDYATAATWFRAAANQGVARAQYDLGVLYERGRGVKVDLTEAANLYLKAAQSGHPLAEYNLAVCYTRGQGIRQDLPEAALWYHRAGSQGVVQAMINLGTMYDQGQGVTASPVDAYAWYLAAGRRNNQAAAHRADEIFNNLSQMDQIRAQALASDVAASIHDPDAEHGEAATVPEPSGAADHR